MKKQYKCEYKKLTAETTTKKKEKIVADYFRGKTYEEVARKHGVPYGFVGHLKREWEKKHLYRGRRG